MGEAKCTYGQSIDLLFDEKNPTLLDIFLINGHARLVFVYCRWRYATGENKQTQKKIWCRWF
jgi:hypothetical protein